LIIRTEVSFFATFPVDDPPLDFHFTFSPTLTDFRHRRSPFPGNARK